MQHRHTNSTAPSDRLRTVLASLNQALHTIMAEDPRVVALGEDILDPYGGAFKVTKGLSTRFPHRVFTAPISEAAIIGMAVGMAMRGLRPIVEIMFGDFLALAADQLINHAAKLRWMYNDEVRVPLVVRTPMGGRRGYGPTHSQCLEKHFLGIPGLLVVAPHILGKPGTLLQQAVECEDPVLFVESKTCYGRLLVTGVPDMLMETYVDDQALFPTTYIHHKDAARPPDGVLCCYGGMVPLCVEAVQELREREGLLIDLAVFTQLSPPPVSHIRHILERSRPSVWAYAEEASPIGGWAAEMIAQIEQLRAEQPRIPAVTHCRIGASFTPVASSRELESQSLPQVADIVRRVVSCF